MLHSLDTLVTCGHTEGTLARSVRAGSVTSERFDVPKSRSVRKHNLRPRNTDPFWLFPGGTQGILLSPNALSQLLSGNVLKSPPGKKWDQIIILSNFHAKFCAPSLNWSFIPLLHVDHLTSSCRFTCLEG